MPLSTAEIVRNIVSEHLEQLASPNLDCNSQESAFYFRVETLLSVRWDNVIAK